MVWFSFLYIFFTYPHSLHSRHSPKRPKSPESPHCFEGLNATSPNQGRNEVYEGDLKLSQRQYGGLRTFHTLGRNSLSVEKGHRSPDKKKVGTGEFINTKERPWTQ